MGVASNAWPHRSRGSRRRKGPSEAVWAAAFILPVAGLAVPFFIWPVIRAIELSFTESGPFGGSKWIGAGNYERLFSDHEVWRAFANSGMYMILVLVGVPLGLLAALLLNSKGLRFVGFFRTVYFLPFILMPTAVALAWRVIFNGSYGPVNQLLGQVGITGPYWLQDRGHAIIVLGIVGVWSSVGYNVVLFLAALQEVPRDLYEAASIDGAGPTRRFFSVTLPTITPTIFFDVVTTVIFSLQMFDILYVMLGAVGGAPSISNPVVRETETLVYLFYDSAFVTNEVGYASAIVTVLFFLIILITMIQFRLQRRWVNYG